MAYILMLVLMTSTVTTFERLVPLYLLLAGYIKYVQSCGTKCPIKKQRKKEGKIVKSYTVDKTDRDGVKQ